MKKKYMQPACHTYGMATENSILAGTTAKTVYTPDGQKHTIETSNSDDEWVGAKAHRFDAWGD